MTRKPVMAWSLFISRGGGKSRMNLFAIPPKALQYCYGPPFIGS